MADGGRQRSRGDDGAATLLVITMAGLLLTIGLALVAVTALFATARRAQSAADLAALAAAHAASEGQDGCATARQVAAANGGRLDRCTVRGADIRVQVSIAAPGAAGGVPRLVGRARAGPAPSPGDAG